MYILIFIQCSSQTFLTLKRTEPNFMMNVHSSSHKVADILSRI